jgi:hypothetical protein
MRLIPLLLAGLCEAASPLRVDTVRVHSDVGRLINGVAPANYHLPEGETHLEYQARFPRTAIIDNVECHSSTTRAPRCRTELVFPDTTIVLEKNSFFSYDSVRQTKGRSGYGFTTWDFQDAYDVPLRSLMLEKKYRLREAVLSRENRIDRSENGGWAAIFSLLPAFGLACIVEKGIAVKREEPFNWGRAGLITAGTVIGIGVTAAISLDTHPTLRITRIDFTPAPKPPRREDPPEALDRMD